MFQNKSGLIAVLNTVFSFYDIFTLSFSLPPSIFFCGFHIKVFRQQGNWYIVFHEMETWLWSSLLPFLQFYSYLLGMKGPDTEIQVNHVFRRLRRSSVLFSVHLLICFVGCYGARTGKASQSVCRSANTRLWSLWYKRNASQIFESLITLGLSVPAQPSLG